MPLVTLLTALAIGVLSGVVAALCGVGGGVVMVPAFVSLLGLPQKVAVATSLAIIIPTSIQSFRTHYGKGKVLIGDTDGKLLANEVMSYVRKVQTVDARTEGRIVNR
jgi:uncharacterized membrane protein YfcA